MIKREDKFEVEEGLGFPADKVTEFIARADFAIVKTAQRPDAAEVEAFIDGNILVLLPVMDVTDLASCRQDRVPNEWPEMTGVQDVFAEMLGSAYPGKLPGGTQIGSC